MLRIKFKYDKNGRKLAYRFQRQFGGGCYIRMNLQEAEMLLAMDKAYIFEI